MLQAVKETQAWRKFAGAEWQREISVRDFIVANLTPYSGGPEFLAKPTKKTLAVWEKLQPYFREEAKKGVLDVDVATPSLLTSHGPGFIDRDNEVIVGLQTADILPELVRAAAWMAGLAGLNAILWNLGLRRYTSMGD